jgi:peptide chain release factor subunit 1
VAVLAARSITADTVRSLTSFDGGGAPVTSCFLDIDGRLLPTHLDVQRSFDQLVRSRSQGETRPSVARDIERMTRHVQGLGRANGVRGLAMFSCSPAGWFEVHELPVRVRNKFAVRHAPYVRPLEEVLNEHQRFGVMLVDRQRARMFVFELGSLMEHTEMLEPLERQGEDVRGERIKTRVDHQRDEQAQQHLRRAARLAFEVYQRVGFDRFILGAPVDVATDLERVLHPYLRGRLVDRVSVAVNASDDDIRRAALEVAERVERKQEAELAASLRDATATGRGVKGLGPTVDAVNTHRVDTLVVSASYTAEGWRCVPCGSLALVGRRCKSCGSDMTHVDDLVEEAVEMTLGQSGHVANLIGNADLDVMGGIGALLRY